MSKKNLMLVVPSLAAGGQERVAVNTAAVLADYYNINFVVFTMDKAVYKPDYTVIDINIPASNNYLIKIFNVFRRVRVLKKLKRELKIDVSYSFGNTANLANVLSKVTDKIIISIRGYAAIYHTVGRFFDRVIYDKADQIVCVSEKMSNDMVNFFCLPDEKVITLYNPYDFNIISQKAQEPILIQIGHPAIVTMGRLEKIKGYIHLLRAFALVQKEMPKAALFFVGEGSERKQLEMMVADLGLEQNVIFTGFQPNPFSYLAKCDVYVLSSINEGFPNALIEAMACGLPVVSTDCKSGPREILTEIYCDRVATEIEYCDYGILVPPFISDESNEPEMDELLAYAMLRLLKDEELRNRYSEAAKIRANLYSLQAYKDKIIQIIESC